MAGLRSYECPRCGAPRQSLDDTLVTMCPYCGAVASVEVSEQQLARWVEAAIGDIQHPERRSALDKRRAKLVRRMAEAVSAKDRDTWRAAVEEVALIDYELYPELHAGQSSGAGDPERRLVDVRRSVAMQEVMTFDADVVRWQREAGEAMMRALPEQDWSSGKARRVPGWSVEDARERAREAVDAWTRVYDAVAERTGDRSFVPAQYGRDAVINGLTGMARARMAGFSRKEARAVCEGIAPASFQGDAKHCAGCGAELGPADAAGLIRCASCGAVSRRA